MPIQFQPKSLPHTFKRFTTQVIYFLVIPFFFLAFAALYKPFNIDTLLNTSKASFSFNITMMMCIILLVMVISRLTLYFSRALRNMTMPWYRIWCIMEIVVSAFFVALYTTLIGDWKMQYFEILVNVAAYLTLVLIFPYALLELALTLSATKHAAETADATDAMLHFYDSRHSLKFVVSAENILYIKADENYITIHYLEGERKKTYEMRSSMKRIEETCLANGILRCHRSFFINPAHVKALRKDKENAIVAELNIPGETPIPVSKTYYEDLVKVL